MNLFINSPAYYTQEYGVIDEIYRLSSIISHSIDVTLYTGVIDTIGITPIIAPKQILNQGTWKEIKKISLTYRMANISLNTDYDDFIVADITSKKKMIIENILNSMYVVKRKLKNDFNYNQIEKDIKILFKELF